MMTHPTLHFLLLLVIGLVSPSAWGANNVSPPEKNPPVDITVSNPAREVGYHVGEILSRTITLKVADQYRILPTSLPIPGNQKRYRNKEQGIELYASKISESHENGQNIYTLDLSYQVFTSSIVAKPAALPPEFIKFSGNGKLFQVRVPSWNFRISPLAVYGSVNISKDMSPLRGPLLISDQRPRIIMNTALAILGLSLLGLLYILGTHAWLPRMGGPFARNYRAIRKLTRDDTGLKTAISNLHEAFKKSCGRSVFSADEIMQVKPAFTPLADELSRFFLLSRCVFFDSSAQNIPADPHAWLKQFSRRCRDIERGMK